MSSASTTPNSSLSVLRRRSGLVVRPFVVGTLVCCAWFVGVSKLGALDLEGIVRIQQRDEAARNLKRASENVEKARALAVAARERLDAFLSQYFDRERRGPRPPASRDGDVDAVVGADPPELELGDVPPEADGQTGPQTAEAENQWAEHGRRLAQEAEEDSDTYRRLYDEWRSAELAVDDALKAERAASERLLAIAPGEPQLVESRPDEKPSVDSPGDARALPAPEPTVTAATPASRRPSESDSAGSQPLALAALLIALAVAALAAVRLARSTANPVFASVDEVAAALAIPVVGIIPAAAARVQRAGSAPSRRRSVIILLCQFFVAGFAFAAVALAVQNPGAFWRFCAHPLETLGLILRAISGGA